MAQRETDMAARLASAYRDLVMVKRSAEGIWYSASLFDGQSVNVLVLDAALAERLVAQDRFLETLERASRVQDKGLSRPVHWGVSEGVAHCAYAREGSAVRARAATAAGVAAIGETVARALSAAHGAGVAHGSIAPERLVRGDDGRIRLELFGLCAALQAGGLGGAETATLLSPAPYVSPETQTGTAPDERSDIYSLGATLYEMLTGKPPFGGRTTSFVMAQVLSDDAGGGLAEHPNDGRPAATVDAILRAIEKAPEDRWPDASAFADALALSEPGSTQKSEAAWMPLVAIFKDAWFRARRSRKE